MAKRRWQDIQHVRFGSAPGSYPRITAPPHRCAPATAIRLLLWDYGATVCKKFSCLPFGAIAADKTDTEFTVKASFMEIFMEKVAFCVRK